MGLNDGRKYGNQPEHFTLWSLDFQRSFKVVGTDTDRSAAYNFLLVFRSNREPMSYRFRDKP